MCITRPLLLLTLIMLNVNKAALQDNDTSTRNVIFVNVLHRHGFRTLFHLYPTDPYQNEFDKIWPEGEGQLTNVGKNQTFQLGQWLRQRYDALLTPLYSPDIIYVQSTDIDRTLMSAECVMAGMYPPKGVQVWSEDLAWQPIPVHTRPVKTDRLLMQPPATPCPAFDKELLRVLSSSDIVREWNKTYSELFRYTSEKAEKSYDLLNIFMIYDVLLIEKYYGMALPEWTKKVFPDPMSQANVDCFRVQTSSDLLIRLKTGLLLKDMINNMLDKVHNKTSKNVHVYSAHDINILYLMTALGIFNDLMPPYAASLMMELHGDSSGDYYVSLVYRNFTNTSREEPYEMTMKDCSPPCSLDKFIAVYRKYIPDDWEKECELHDESNLFIFIIVIVILVILVVVMGAVAFVMWKKYAYSHKKTTSQTQETSQNTTDPAPTTESAAQH